jgi:large exoprotein involved in heme utilization and adhesion
VTASDSVELSGGGGLYASTEGEGDAGDLTIATGRLLVRDGAVVSVSSEGSRNAGNLEVTADSIGLSNRATLSANTTAGQGNIFLRSGDLVLRRGSNIRTEATGIASGGNININSDVIAALENSDISANSANFFGGRITINAQGIFGTEFRLNPTSDSDITATGGIPDFSGTVEINTPDVDPSQGLATLPAELVETSGLIASNCAAVGENNFIITGRGGLPPTPSDTLSALAVLADWATLPQKAGGEEGAEGAEGASKSPPAPPATPAPPPLIVEAQGWAIDDKGEVVLTATAPNVTPHNSWIPSATCHTP